MKNKSILIITFAFLTFTLPGQKDSAQGVMSVKSLHEKPDNVGSSIQNCPQYSQIRSFNWGYQIGMGKFNRNRFFLNYLSSYRLNPYLSLGYGGALHFYNDAILLPVLTELKLNFTDKNKLPYLGIRFGAPFIVSGSKYFYDTGYLLGLSLGYKFDISKNTLLNIEAGYVFQEADIYNYSRLNDDVILHALSLSVGLMFCKSE